MRVPLRILTIALLFAASSVFAQRIEATVNPDLGRLGQEAEQKLAGFTETLEQYLNNSPWCEDIWDTPIYLNVQLSLQYSPSGTEDRYTGRMVIDNSYDILFTDTRFRFAYQQNEMLNYDENRATSLTALINFYVNMVLGGEFDKWGTLAGQRYYEKARRIAEQAKFNLSEFQLGWDYRLEDVDQILSERHRPFREMVDYYYYGISYIDQDNAKTRKHVATAIEMLDEILRRDPDDEFAQNFIKAHFQEIVEIYRYAVDQQPLRTMMVLDNDAAHKRVYEDILEG